VISFIYGAFSTDDRPDRSNHDPQGRKGRYYRASANKTIVEEVKSMAGMSQVIYSKGIAEGISQGISQGIAQGISQGREQGVSQGITIGQNNLVTAVERLRSGETREELIASGLDQHTVDLAITIK
jgi:flagellar biosynthesis/type III secretory pathway protein FliH